MSEKLEKIKENFKRSNKYLLYCDYNDIEFLLEKIDKQQKEIEELKKPKYMINLETGTITTIDSNFISKDKIRAKIKELDKEYKEIQERQIEMSTFMKIAEKRKNKKDILEELLEED